MCSAWCLYPGVSLILVGVIILEKVCTGLRTQAIVITGLTRITTDATDKTSQDKTVFLAYLRILGSQIIFLIKMIETVIVLIIPMVLLEHHFLEFWEAGGKIYKARKDVTPSL
uniref:Putative product n=1 Tax=Xenopsylla cheopis TaxID=163159 RepID=A0A6M2DZ05_XENCH